MCFGRVSVLDFALCNLCLPGLESLGLMGLGDACMRGRSMNKFSEKVLEISLRCRRVF